MPLDAVEELLSEVRFEDTERKSYQRFTFEWLAEQVIDRQVYGKDTIIIIIGDRRAGKSNWGLKLTRAYIKLRKKAEQAKGKDFKWSWDGNFPITRNMAIKTASINYMSFNFYDEGGDQFYTTESLKRAQRKLVKFFNKSGSKLNLTVICWPDIWTLDPKIINMATLLVIVPYRFKDVCSWAFIYGKSSNPLTYDRFGIMKIRKKLESPTKASIFAQNFSMDGTFKVRHRDKEIEINYPKGLFKFLRSIPSFMKMHRFGPVDQRFEDAYIKNVKNKQQTKDEDEDNYVPMVQYQKLKTQYETLLHNLYVKQDMSFAQLERLHISPVDGAHLRAIEGIRKSINSIKAMS
ncbi:MAG: hypothetical protein NTU57_02640 [Candidatus Aenigmarchaeota archaeon]|nr:hypothetical protein [Candidatus Aenigmarchaeota archaeon]